MHEDYHKTHLKAGDVIFTSRSLPIYIWQKLRNVPYPKMTHCAIALGGSTIFEAMPVRGKGINHITSGEQDIDYRFLKRWHYTTAKKRHFYVLRPTTDEISIDM